ncbi:MAG: polysaccharide biosynthesis C-terminal domain-containing protein [Candidatus Methylomirabilales bacterium]
MRVVQLTKSQALRELLCGSSWCTVASLISRVSSILVSVVLARMLGTAGLGEYGIVIAFASILVTGASLGAGSGTVKTLAAFMVCDRGVTAGRLWAVVALGTGGAVFFGLAGVIASDWVASLYGVADRAMTFRLGALGAIFLALGHLGSNILLGLKRYREYAKSVVVPAVLSLPATLMLSKHLGVEGAVAAFAAMATCQTAVAWWMAWRLCQKIGVSPGMTGAGQAARELLGVSIPSSILNVAIAGVLWLTQTMLALRAGFEAIGLFRVALAVQSTLILVPLGIGLSSLPIMSEMFKAGRRELLGTIIDMNLRLTLLLILPAIGFLTFASKPLIAFVYGSSFVPAALAVAIMGVTAVPMAVSNTMGQAFIVSGRAWALLPLSSVWTVSLVVSAGLLVSPLAASGLASAHFLAYLFHVGVLTRAIRRIVDWRATGLRFWLWSGGLLFLAGIQWLAIPELPVAAAVAVGGVAGGGAWVLVWRLCLGPKEKEAIWSTFGRVAPRDPARSGSFAPGFE